MKWSRGQYITAVVPEWETRLVIWLVVEPSVDRSIFFITTSLVSAPPRPFWDLSTRCCLSSCRRTSLSFSLWSEDTSKTNSVRMMFESREEKVKTTSVFFQCDLTRECVQETCLKTLFFATLVTEITHFRNYHYRFHSTRVKVLTS